MQLTLTKADYKSFFTYQYFFGAKSIRRYIRLFAGPILVLLGINFLYNDDNRFGIAFGGFCLGYGIYYTLKPFLFILIKKFPNETFTYNFSLDTLHIQDSISNTLLDLKEFPIQKNSKYYFILLENGSLIFFPKNKLSREDVSEFEKRIK